MRHTVWLLALVVASASCAEDHKLVETKEAIGVDPVELSFGAIIVGKHQVRRVEVRNLGSRNPVDVTVGDVPDGYIHRDAGVVQRVSELAADSLCMQSLGGNLTGRDGRSRKLLPRRDKPSSGRFTEQHISSEPALPPVREARSGRGVRRGRVALSAVRQSASMRKTLAPPVTSTS